MPIYGPRGLDAFLLPFIEQNKQYLGYEIEIHILDEGLPQLAYEDRSVSVTTLPLKHGVPCVGYLIREKVTERHIVLHAISTKSLAPSIPSCVMEETL